MKSKIFILKLLFIIGVTILGTAGWIYLHNREKIYLYIGISAIISSMLLYRALMRNKDKQ